MCRYAMSLYKPHYACFECRKTFKRKLMWDIKRTHEDSVEAKCPECGSLMANMGLDFESPKKDNIKEWNHLRSLYSVGITFHSCGCTGPGYIPNTHEKLIEYFQDILRNYHFQLDFWRNRIEPTNHKEIQRDESRNWNFISKVPSELRPKKGAVSNEDARIYWLSRIKEIELKLEKIK
jgi:DNA-directed RNA polymerase subunit RPC12/RpoP